MENFFNALGNLFVNIILFFSLIIIATIVILLIIDMFRNLSIKIFNVRENTSDIIGALCSIIFIAIGITIYLNLEISKDEYKKLADKKETCIQKSVCTELIDEDLIDNKISNYEKFRFLYYMKFEDGLDFLKNELKKDNQDGTNKR